MQCTLSFNISQQQSSGLQLCNAFSAFYIFSQPFRQKSFSTAVRPDLAHTTYELNARCGWTIAPENVTSPDIPYILHFVSLETEPEFDIVNIYNGTDPSDPDTLLASLQGHDENILYLNNATGSGSNTFANVPSVTVTFATDNSVTFDGFTAIYHVPSALNTEFPNLCVNNCTGNGVCIDGVCHCFPGYEGGDCRRDDVFVINKIVTSCSFNQWTRCGYDWSLSPQTVASDLCTWSCLTCYNDRLAHLDLHDSNLYCLDPQTNASRLSDLNRFAKYSEVIDLENNRIGSFPRELYLSPGLSELHLRNISLSGSIPKHSLTSTSSLLHVDLSDNRLSGPIDPLLRRLTQLKSLNLENNRFGGFLIDDFQYLPEKSVFLAGNKLWCPTPAWTSIASIDCINITLNFTSTFFGTAAGGYNITIYGSNFPLEIPVDCAFDGIIAPKTVVLSPTEIICSVPAVPPRIAGLSLMYQGTPASINSLQFTFTVSCPEGTYPVNSSSCMLCPAGAYCKGDRFVPEPKPGYVRSTLDPLKFFPCFADNVCIGEILMSKYTNTSSDGIMDTNSISDYFSAHEWSALCKAGYEGPQCAVCQPGWYATGHNTCSLCPADISASRAVLIIFVAFIACALLFYATSVISEYSTTFVIITFIQFTGLFSKYNFHWNEMLGHVLEVFEAFELNMDQIGLEKVWRAKTVAMRGSVVRGVIMICLLLHIPLTQSGFNMFLCASNGDRSYLVPRPDITCGTPAYNAALSKAGGIIAMYGFGIPLVFLLTTVYLSYRNILYHEEIREMFGPLYIHYRSSFHYWETVKLLLHLLLLAAPFLLNSDPDAIAFVVTFSLTVYGCAIMRFMPYRFPRTNLMTMVGFSSLPIVIITGLIQEGDYNYGAGKSSSGSGSGSGHESSHTSSPKIFSISYAILAYHFACLAIQIHALLYEIQYMNYLKWAKIKRLRPILESKLFLFLFPNHGGSTSLEYIAFRRGSDYPTLQQPEIENGSTSISMSVRKTKKKKRVGYGQVSPSILATVSEAAPTDAEVLRCEMRGL
ncbi:hypothetical protein HK102_010437 [Quaeritorhiza haematococci]|nr:hypothetical protein HK102_010437 [Quaeritorhiza haematococci]